MMVSIPDGIDRFSGNHQDWRKMSKGSRLERDWIQNVLNQPGGLPYEVGPGMFQLSAPTKIWRIHGQPD